MDGTGFHDYPCPGCGDPLPICDPCWNCSPPLTVWLWRKWREKRRRKKEPPAMCLPSCHGRDLGPWEHDPKCPAAVSVPLPEEAE